MVERIVTYDTTMLTRRGKTLTLTGVRDRWTYSSDGGSAFVEGRGVSDQLVRLSLLSET